MATRAKGAWRFVALEIRKFAGAVRRELALEIVDILRYTNPFATGHSRNNWIPSLGAPSNEISGSRAQPSNEAQKRGIAQISEEPLDSRRVANVVNNVEYVRHLNEGSSQQAPSGYIQAAIMQAMVNVKLRIGELKRAKGVR